MAIWTVIFLVWMVYVTFSLSAIKHKQNLIIRHFNIAEKEPGRVPDEEIEKELEQNRVK